ncbi:MAG: RNA-binding protein [Euryarchaeota archaeon]|nr:RNA-binding protein [Euryarchaeota archaeon]
MLELRHRHRLRRKEIRKLADDIEAALGVRTFDEGAAVDLADAQRFEVVVFDNSVVAVVFEGKAFLTVRGLLRWPASRAHVSIDEGAVKYICNGADVMGPGITGADPAIREGDPVWVRDTRHQKPLAIGRALAGGAALASKAPGKAVKNLHYIGDELWNLGVTD